MAKAKKKTTASKKTQVKAKAVKKPAKSVKAVKKTAKAAKKTVQSAKPTKKTTAKKAVSKSPLKKSSQKNLKKSSAKVTQKAAKKSSATTATKASVKSPSSKAVLAFQKNLTPLDDRLLISVKGVEKKTPGGLIIPDTVADQSGNLQGLVKASGRGHLSKKGRLRSMDVHVGDQVLFSEYSGTKVELQGEDFVIIRESDVLGILQK